MAPVAFDGLDQSRSTLGGLSETAAHLLEHDVDGFSSVQGSCRQPELIIAALLELLEQVGRRLGGRLC